MEFSQRKSAFIKANGDPVTILRDSGNLSTVARIMAMKRRTGFFSINYLREALFTADSGVLRGNLIRDEATGELFFVEGFQEKTFQGVVTSIDVELYAVNYESVQIQRFSPLVDNFGNSVGQEWTIVDNVPMNVEHMKGDTQFHNGLLLVDTIFTLTLQTVVDLQLEDRVIIDGRNYQVSDINLSVIPGLQVAQAKVDMR